MTARSTPDCPECEGAGYAISEWGRYLGHGDVEMIESEYPCEECGGTGLAECDCGDSATVATEAGPMCSECADAYDREDDTSSTGPVPHLSSGGSTWAFALIVLILAGCAASPSEPCSRAADTTSSITICAEME